MKKIFLSVLFVYASLIYANEPMFSPDTEWHYWKINSLEQTDTMLTYGIVDTLINGVAFQFTHDALLRTEGSKVWCIIDSMGESVEQLLYDFDMQIGDSIRTLFFPYYDPEEPPHYAQVTQIDTITLLDGRSARRISYDSRADDIEHVGNVNGILEAAHCLVAPDGAERRFICCTYGDYLLYEVETGLCDKITGMDVIISDDSSTFPFLRDGQIFILRGDKIYTLQGQEVKE